MVNEGSDCSGMNGSFCDEAWKVGCDGMRGRIYGSIVEFSAIESPWREKNIILIGSLVKGVKRKKIYRLLAPISNQYLHFLRLKQLCM